MTTPFSTEEASRDDKARGSGALDEVSEAALALPKSDVLRITASLLDAGLTAVGVARRIAGDQDLLARLRRLEATGELDPVHLERLEKVGWACVHLQTHTLQQRATSSGAQVPVEVVNEAAACKDRMLRVVEYHLGDHPMAGPEVAAIRLGAGYTDLALDLERLAELYDLYRALIESDTKHYVATDADTALSLNESIFWALSKNRVDSLPEDLPARVFTLLRTSYDEVRAGAQWLLRRDPQALRSFPALHATRGVSRKPAEDAPPVPPAEVPEA